MNYLISFPHSGNTFTRYIIEYLTGQPSKDLMANGGTHPSQLPCIHSEGEPIVYKRHDWDGVGKEDSVLFIIRNYKEAIISFLKKKPINLESIKYQIERSDGYIDVLNKYLEFEGKKDIIFYERLIQVPQTEILKICMFFDISVEKGMSFLKNLDHHIKESLKNYPRSATKGKSVNYHNNKLTPEENIELNEYVSKNHPLINKYLSL